MPIEPETEDRLCVLLVDDDPTALRWLAESLAAAQIETRMAVSGEAAIASLGERPVDAVLLDVRMSGIDGFETCRQLRRIDASLPVIFMTGLGESEHVVRGFEAGGTDYVTKPLAVDEVVARLRAHVRTAGLLRRTRALIESGQLPLPGTSVSSRTQAAVQLTARESEVLLWVSRGKTNRDIADILGMSPRTVNKHLEHVFEKLGVETRTAAAAAARSLKLG